MYRGRRRNEEEYDYETLLRLDENNVQVGASEEQILALPSVKYREEGEGKDQCTICLSEFEKGEELKMLGCLHKFHTDCIANWLKKKKECSVCRHVPFDN